MTKFEKAASAAVAASAKLTDQDRLKLMEALSKVSTAKNTEKRHVHQLEFLQLVNDLFKMKLSLSRPSGKAPSSAAEEVTAALQKKPASTEGQKKPSAKAEANAPASLDATQLMLIQEIFDFQERHVDRASNLHRTRTELQRLLMEDPAALDIHRQNLRDWAKQHPDFRPASTKQSASPSPNPPAAAGGKKSWSMSSAKSLAWLVGLIVIAVVIIFIAPNMIESTQDKRQSPEVPAARHLKVPDSIKHLVTPPAPQSEPKEEPRGNTSIINTV